MLWDKQHEVFESVVQHKRTAVKSGNAVGKTLISAEITLWFLLSYFPRAKVVITAPTWHQVEEIIWNEIASLYNRALLPIGGKLLNTSLEFNEDCFAIGISTNEVNRFQGFHSENLLVILDEALGVEPVIWEAMEGLHPSRVLAIGNPLEGVGDFYNCFSSRLWNKITINCEDCVKWQERNHKIPGLVTREWIDERVDEWGRGSPLYEARVLGDFPLEAENALIRRDWVEQCRKTEPLDDEEEAYRIEACDLASKHGKSETVKTYRYGHTIKEIKAYHIPLTETRDILIWDYMQKRLKSLVIDADGMGEGLDDMLREKHVAFEAFHGGYASKAFDETKYKNLRSQFYCIVAKKFEKGLYSLSSLPAKEYEILKNQLCSIKVKLPDARGRVQVETKEDMQARQVKSPDYADSFMMSEYGWYMGRYADIKAYKYR